MSDAQATQQNSAADTSALEAEIDRHVYALYGLTGEEIAIVESASAGDKLRRDKSAPAGDKLRRDTGGK